MSHKKIFKCHWDIIYVQWNAAVVSLQRYEVINQPHYADLGAECYTPLHTTSYWHFHSLSSFLFFF